MSRRRTTDLFSVALIVYGIIFQLLVSFTSFKYLNSLTAAFIIIILALSISLLGFKRNVNTNLKKSILSVTIVFVLAYFAITYGIGFAIGYNKNAYSMELSSLIGNIISPIITIICIELIRYIYIENNKFSKQSIGFIIFSIIIFEICINTRLKDFDNIEFLFVSATTIILPIISKNLVLSYLTYNVGYRPALLYRLIMDISVFVLPVVPAFGDYLNSVVGILSPALLYIYVSRIIEEYYNGFEYNFSINKFHWTDIPYMAFLLMLIALISGKFQYTIMGVGSDSMHPYIDRGDAVLLNSSVNKNKLKTGDVIAFENDNKVVIHRLFEIKEEKDKTYYITKGDANNTTDDIEVTYSDIIGVVKFRIKYLAYPTVYLNDLFSKGVS